MTFLDISLKMLKKGLLRYRLYFLCSFFALTLFFCFAALLTNPSFMEGFAVDPMISSNVYFPSLLAAAFLLLFVPYSYAVFLSARKQEYGILFSLGLGRLEGLKWLLGESAALGAAALGGAFLAGTGVSYAFYGILVHVMGIHGLRFGISGKAYAITALLYGAVLASSALLLAFQLLGRRIHSLLLAPYQAEQKGRGYRWLQKHFPSYARKRLLECSLLARHKMGWAIRCCFSALLFGAALYLIGFCAAVLPSLPYGAARYCPYDLAYAESFLHNRISGEALRECLSRHGAPLQEEIQIPFARDAAFNYLPVSEVNQKLGCSYEVPPGSFLNLFQEDLEDGYGTEGRLTETSHISICLDAEAGDTLELDSCGSNVRILFNRNPAFADRTLLLNDGDYQKIASIGPYWQNTMHLIQLWDWESSAGGAAALQDLLQEANGLSPEEQWRLRATAKITELQTARQSCQCGFFLMGFIELLMLMAACLLIHFRIAAEQEENRRMAQSLFLIGATDEELFGLCLFKNRLRFLPPLLAGLLASLPPVYWQGEAVYHSGMEGCLAAGLAAALLCLAASKFTSAYSRRELQALTASSAPGQIKAQTPG